MSTRDHFLANIHRQRPDFVELPEIHSENFTQYTNLFAEFSERLLNFGGIAIQLQDEQTILQTIEQHWSDYNQGRIVNLMEEEKHEKNTRPHDYKNVDIAIVKGDLAVAENAAVWVNNTTSTHRSIYFLCQRLVMVVPRTNLLHNMHQAYSRINFHDRKFGTFIAGASRTADIEQSLVLGAHGAMVAMVIFV